MIALDDPQQSQTALLSHRLAFYSTLAGNHKINHYKKTKFKYHQSILELENQYKKGGIIKKCLIYNNVKKSKIKLFMVLSIIAMIAFAGCTGKSENTNNTPQGNVQIPQGEKSKTSDIKPGYGSNTWCVAGTSIETMSPKGNTVTLVIRGITTFEGNEVCETGWISPEEGSLTMYTSHDTKFTVTIIKDKNGVQTNRIGG